MSKYYCVLLFWSYAVVLTERTKSLAGFELIIFVVDARALLLHNYDKLSRIFSCISLIRNHVIFLEQFGINKHLLDFFKKFALALLARTILSVFEKIYSSLLIKNWTWNHVIAYTYLNNLVFLVDNSWTI